jgi:GTPase SAR1 family protein
MYKSFCPFPNDNSKVLIGGSNGELYIGKLKDFSNKVLTDQEFWECLMEIESPESIQLDNVSSSIRNLIKLSKHEIVGHSYRGDVFLFDCLNNELYQIREGYSSSRSNMYQIASADSNQFVTCGNYGSFWFFNRRNDGSWEIKPVNFSSQHAHFALEVYNMELKSYVINNYVGSTNLMDNSGTVIKTLGTFDNNLQNLIIQEDLIIAVDYYGNTHLYSKSTSGEFIYRKIQTIDCDSKTGIYPHIIFGNDFFFAGFPNSLWKFEPALTSIQKMDIACQDICNINNNVVVLTKNSIILVNSDKFFTPTDFIKYEYITIGIVGYTDSGKSTFCYRLIYDEYKDDLNTTSGTLTWNLDLDNDKKIFIKDIPGQHDEIGFYFPKLKKCDLLIGMCKIKDSIKPWIETVEMCDTIRENYGVKNFIFLRSKSDDKVKAREEAIKKELQQHGFDPNLLFDVSAKDNTGIAQVNETLKAPSFWENSKISTENKIKTKLMLKIGEVRASKQKTIKLEHLKIPDYENINPNLLEKIIIKLAEEDQIYYITTQKQILLDTEEMGEVESYILNLFSEGEGLYHGKELQALLKDHFIRLDKNELDYYYDQFIKYLLEENKLTEILPDIYVLSDKLKTNLDIPEIHLCTEIKIEKPILVSEIIDNFISKNMTLKDISQNKILFTDSSEYGKIFIDLPEVEEFSKNFECKHLKVFFKYSNDVENAFISFYENVRSHILTALPRILNFENTSVTPIENCLELFSYVNEAPNIDFKTILNYKKGKKGVLSAIQKEIIKDIIALGNSSFYFNNISYYVIGVEEKDGKYKSLQNIERQDTIFQQIAFLCRGYIQIGFNLKHLQIKVYDLYKMINNGEIEVEIPFSEIQKQNTCEDELFIIQITREKNSCLELRKELNWRNSKGIKNLISKGTSWIRIGSHTFGLLNEERKTLLLN